MIKKWELAPSPTSKNPNKHKLLLKGEMTDVFMIVKKLGSICSRPEKLTGDFNFLIYLSDMDPEVLKKLKYVMAELSKMEKAALEESRRTRATAPSVAVNPPVPPKPGASVREQEPAPSQPQAPVKKQEPVPKVEKETVVPKMPDRQPEQAVPPSIQPPKPAVPVVPPSVQPPKPAAPVGPPRQPVRVPAAQSKEEIAKIEEKVKEKPPVPAEKPREQMPGIPSAKLKWSIEMPLIPIYSFDTLIAGSHNRFAHAASMAVVENPGMIYNPLLMFGVPGTGKTHFVHSIAYGLSSSIGHGSVIITDAIKLSRGIDIAVRDGTISKVEEMFSNAKALIIDDIHLLMLSEDNKKYLSKWLGNFVSQNRQIVATSVFPPKALSGMEDNLGFQFTQGWMVDLKTPNSQTYRMILGQILQGIDVKLAEDDITAVFTNRMMPLSEAVKILDNVKKLEKFILASNPDITHKELIEMLLGLSESTYDTAVSEEEFARAEGWSKDNKSKWMRWGLFYPKGLEREAKWVLYRIFERGQELGVHADWEQVFIEEYNPDELYGIPFKIGDYSNDKKVNGVIVMGPQPSSALGAQEAEVKQVTFKILSSFLIKSAWLGNSQLKSPAAYVKILMDLI